MKINVSYTPEEIAELLMICATVEGIRTAQLEGNIEQWIVEPLHRPNLEQYRAKAQAWEDRFRRMLNPR